jgi:hypothetical protein
MLSTSRKPVNMVFIGEIGEGKTTLVTSLSDYILGKNFD